MEKDALFIVRKFIDALNEKSYNVKICAKNNRSIAISNYCSNLSIDL